jgi:hypothetical protein
LRLSAELRVTCRAENGAIFEQLKTAKRDDFYHLLWFWGGVDLSIASFRQKLFLLDAGIARFSAKVASSGHRDSWP